MGNLLAGKILAFIGQKTDFSTGKPHSKAKRQGPLRGPANKEKNDTAPQPIAQTAGPRGVERWRKYHTSTTKLDQPASTRKRAKKRPSEARNISQDKNP